MKPWRSKKYLRAVAELGRCQTCGVEDGTIVPAHFSGLYASSLGKGMGQKSADNCVAALCGKCHADFDTYVVGNTEARAALFMMAILKTQHALLQNGVSLEASCED